MAKSKYVYTCNQCGYESSKWNGKCPSCGAWNSFEEEIADASPAGGGTSLANVHDLYDDILELADIGADSDVRYDTGIGELNRVLGGGLVKGSLVLVGGDPGIGKSTLLLQICKSIQKKVLYI